MHIDEIYKTEAFRLLAQGMKDRTAISIVYVLTLVNLFDEFEGMAKSILEDQDAELASFDKMTEAAAMVLNKRLAEGNGLHGVSRDMLNAAFAVKNEPEPCPICSGDCAGANPPVYNCPLDRKRDAHAKVDQLAYDFWSVHPKYLDEWVRNDDHPPMPEGYRGGVRAWFFACEMRKLLGA
ncbi:hypothetical protein [Rhizobium phage RHph_X3_2]|nr:hypothetical protein [Rhizobium phage RHph_X3_2]